MCPYGHLESGYVNNEIYLMFVCKGVFSLCNILIILQWNSCTNQTILRPTFVTIDVCSGTRQFTKIYLLLNI